MKQYWKNEELVVAFNRGMWNENFQSSPTIDSADVWPPLICAIRPCDGCCVDAESQMHC